METEARIESRAWLHVGNLSGEAKITIDESGWAFTWFGPSGPRVVDFGEAGDGVHRFLGKLALLGEMSQWSAEDWGDLAS